MTTTTIPNLDRARLAQIRWAGLTVAQRLAPVRVFRRLLVQRADDLAAAEATDLGKASHEVIGGEVLPTADACRFLEKEAARMLRPRRVPSGQRPLIFWGQSDTVHRRPRGIVGIIGTWNYPLFLNAIQILQALTAGNAVVWKPSEVAPVFARLMTEMLEQVNLPGDLVTVLPATREMGPILADMAIDHVVFTGSAPVGRKLAATLGERLISSTLELSGCDAQIVLADADVSLATRAAWFGTTINKGQTCIAVRRAFVARPLYPAFCEQLKALSKDAPPVSLAMPGQVRQAETLVSDALKHGGRLLGDTGLSAKETSCRPVIIIDARPEMALCREASFAPLMAVLPFDTIEELLQAEEQCPCALGASIFTRNTTVAAQIASRLRAGMVTVNDVIVPTAHPATPFGGRGESGWGVTQGAEGLLEMTVPQVLSVKGGTFRPHFEMNDPLKGPAQGELLRGMLDAQHAPTFGQRMRGWWRVLKAIWRGV